MSLVLAFVVMTSSGGFLAEKTPTPGMLLGAAPRSPADADLYNMSLTELTAERLNLQESMPSPGVGIALTAVGGGLLITGLFLMAYTFVLEPILIGVALSLVSIPLLIIGPILIGSSIRERRQNTTRIRAIDARIAQMNRDGQLPPPTGRDDVPPPPPPMPPPGVNLGPAALPTMFVASF